MEPATRPARLSPQRKAFFVTASIISPAGLQHPAITALRAYLAGVGRELGVGLESCTIDHDTPVSAYLALDIRLPQYPGRDVALLWDERHGWAAAVETHSGEDLLRYSHLGGNTVFPPPRVVADFVTTLHDQERRVTPPEIREATGLDDLAELAHAELSSSV